MEVKIRQDKNKNIFLDFKLVYDKSITADAVTDFIKTANKNGIYLEVNKYSLSGNNDIIFYIKTNKTSKEGEKDLTKEE